MTSRYQSSTAEASIEVDVAAGCRLSSLEIRGRQILVTGASRPIDWGLYPMAPYAGRVRNGRFAFAGSTHRLRATDGDHAIHGTVLDRPWTPEGDGSFVIRLGEFWPFPGYARQRIRLGSGQLDLQLEVHAEGTAMPASCGWHPWLRRQVAGARAELDFRPGFMLRRDEHGIATRDRVAPSDGPWDDCFGGVERPPSIRWPGFAALTIESTCRYWTVFNERDHALCVEPQTAPPDDVNNDPFIVEPGRPLIARMTMRWELE